MNELARMNTKMKKMIKFGIRSLGTVIGMAIIGILLLTLSFSLPVNQHTKESTFMYSGSMGWAPLVNNRYMQYTSYFTSYEPGILDDATDKIILTNCFDEGEGSALKRAADMNDYGRYWHGYVSILRPIFYFMDYWDFLLFNSVLQLLIMGCVGYAIHKVTEKKRYLLAFFSSCVFLVPVATGMSLQYSPVFYISLIGSLFCLLKADWLLQKNRRYDLFLFLGILTCYFDFLTYPLLSFAFPFCWFLVAAGEKMDMKAQLKLLFGGGLTFLMGYGGFFVAKWIIHALICGTGDFLSGLAKVIFHVGNVDDSYRLLHQNYCRIDTLYNNFRHYLYPLFVIVMLVWIVVLLHKYMTNGVRLSNQSIIFAMVTLTSPAWYFIVNTHTALHHLFTFRIYCASILGFMLFVCSCVEAKCKERSVRIQRVLVVFLCVAVGVCASRLAKEDRTTLNGGENTELWIGENDVFEVTFSPTIENIKSFSFLYHTSASVEGDVIIELCDNGAVLELKTVPIAEYRDKVFDLELLDWKLQKGKQYTLRLTVKGDNAGISLLVSPEGDETQPEYGRAYLNGKELGDVAPLSNIVYRGHVQTKIVKLYISICFGAFVLVWALVVCHCCKLQRRFVCKRG